MDTVTGAARFVDGSTLEVALNDLPTPSREEGVERALAPAPSNVATENRTVLLKARRGIIVVSGFFRLLSPHGLTSCIIFLF